jgi:hypothetical protein
MAAVFPDEGKKLALDILLDTGRSPKLRLFSNNLTPGVANVVGDFTEATFGGYAAIDLSAMAAAAINGSDQGFKQLLANSFTATGAGLPQTIYGWYITIHNIGGADKLFLCERFPAAQLVASSGDSVQFDLTVLDELGP